MVGLGTYSLKGEGCLQAVYEALRLGIVLCRAVNANSVFRKEIFVITKHYPIPAVLALRLVPC